MSPDGLIKFLETYWHKRTAKAGLFFGLLVLSSVWLALLGIFSPILQIIGLFSADKNGYQIYYTIGCAIWLLLCAAYLIAWLYWRQILVPHDSAIIVLFAPWAEDDHQN